MSPYRTSVKRWMEPPAAAVLHDRPVRILQEPPAAAVATTAIAAFELFRLRTRHGITLRAVRDRAGGPGRGAGRTAG
ncbi:hypothetical protein [Streptomyces sp. NPDC089799]|uniref:hypothetical protein n=1 Tax=Streptomyces sp. NPDC089799 TaxID=3155066 RepID=UPI00341C7A84